MTQLRPVNYALKPAAIDKAKPHATATDGGGLYVEVLPSGSKVWRYKYHRQGKREKVTIGPLSVDRRQSSPATAMRPCAGSCTAAKAQPRPNDATR